MARRTKLKEPKIRARLIEALKDGCTHKLSCQYAGVHVSRFYAWMSRGREDDKGIYKDFHDDVKLAEAEGAIENLKTIKAASKTDWRASAWLLERRHPEYTVHVTPNQQPTINIDITTATITQLIRQISTNKEVVSEIMGPVIDLDEE